MTDALGWRTKFAVVAPSTNTIVQPDFDDMRPVGVTNHFGRIAVPNMPLRNDEDFIALMKLIEGELTRLLCSAVLQNYCRCVIWNLHKVDSFLAGQDVAHKSFWAQNLLGSFSPRVMSSVSA